MSRDNTSLKMIPEVVEGGMVKSITIWNSNAADSDAMNRAYRRMSRDEVVILVN